MMGPDWLTDLGPVVVDLTDLGPVVVDLADLGPVVVDLTDLPGAGRCGPD